MSERVPPRVGAATTAAVADVALANGRAARQAVVRDGPLVRHAASGEPRVSRRRSPAAIPDATPPGSSKIAEPATNTPAPARTARGDTLPDHVELLDQRVEAAVQQHRTARRRSGGAKSVGGKRCAGVRDLVADRATVAEGAIEEVAIAPVDRASGPRPLGSEELGDAKIARRVAESALGLGAFGQGGEHLGAVVEPSDGTRRGVQLVANGVPQGMGAIELVVDDHGRKIIRSGPQPERVRNHSERVFSLPPRVR